MLVRHLPNSMTNWSKMQRQHRIIKTLITLGTLTSLLAVICVSGIFLYLNPRLPSVETLLEAELQIPLRIFSHDDQLIGEYGEKFRTPIKRDQIPEQFINAILAAEDDRFLQHKGIDLAGLARAALELLRSGEIQTGGSTITMQVARNFFLSSERSFARKFNEILLSLKIERLLSKDEILELYVNKIYLGKRAYGIQAAAAIYYGKNVNELSLAQLAMIAGLPKAPSAYNPVNNPDRARIRRDWILGRMFNLGYIDRASYDASISAPVTASYHGPKLQLDARYAAEMARAFVVDKFGTQAYTDGLRVITTINSQFQDSADSAIVEGLQQYTERHGYRGPEQKLADVHPAEQIAILNNLITVRNRVPALVTKLMSPGSHAESAGSLPETPADNTDVQSQENRTLVQLLLPGGINETLSWNPETDGLRKYISENRRTEKIDAIEQLIEVGDIIRIEYDTSGNPKLSELPQASASLVSIDPYDGAIKAIVGGYDFASSKFNRATQAYRQPGSNFKPFIYAAAFDLGHTPASVINDAPIVFNDEQLETDWRPENASGKFYGPTTLRRALYLSRNLVSVRLLREVGINNVVNYLQRFDFSAGPLPKNLSLSLGSYAMTPVEIASLYAVIANGGYKVHPYIVEAVYDRGGRLIYSANPAVACDDCLDDKQKTTTAQISALEGDTAETGSPARKNLSGIDPKDANDYVEAESLEDLLSEDTSSYASQQEDSAGNLPPHYAERVMDARVAFILDNILLDVIKRGTATKARELGRDDLAGKTGTTNGPTDAWFSGYHPKLVTTTWLGFDDNQNLGRREYGGSAALPIWMDYMKNVLPDLPRAKRTQPQGLLALKIDRLTGGAPTAKTEETLFEFFLEEHAPDFNQQHSHALSGQLESSQEEDIF